MRIRTALDGQLDLRLRLTNATSETWLGSLDLLVEAENHHGRGISLSRQITLPPGVHEIDQTLRIPDPQLWWPWDQGAPDLYRLNALLVNPAREVVAEAHECFGVRTVRLER